LVNTPAAGEPNDRSFDDFASGHHHQELLAGKPYSNKMKPRVVWKSFIGELLPGAGTT